jgi:hypothetical protein
VRNIGDAYNIIDTIESEIVIDINIKDRRGEEFFNFLKVYHFQNLKLVLS